MLSNHSSFGRVLRLAVVAGLIGGSGLAAAGCSKTEPTPTTGGATGASGASSTTGGGGAGAGAGATSTTIATKLFDTDFEPVCNGASQSKAAAYDATGKAPHPVLVFAGKGEDKYTRSGYPADWTITWSPDTDALTGIQLVACAERTEATFTKECTGYQDDGKDTGNVVKLHDATYAVTLFEAKTGKEVATTTLVAKDDSCPSFVMFSKGEPTKDEFAFDDDAMQKFLKPHVQP